MNIIFDGSVVFINKQKCNKIWIKRFDKSTKNPLLYLKASSFLKSVKKYSFQVFYEILLQVI